MIEIIETEIYETKMIIPKSYQKGYSHPNYYPDVIPGYHAYGGIVEQRVQALLIQYFLEGWSFIDIGAGCGVYSVLAEHFKATNIFSFEPNGDAFACLGQNVQIAQTFNCALSDSNKKTYFTGESGTGIIQLSNQPDYGRTPVDCRMLDSFDIRAEIVKIDVEGMAGEVIDGGKKTLYETKIIFVEIHSREELGSVWARLLDLGFTVKRITESHLIGVKDPYPLPQKGFK